MALITSSAFTSNRPLSIPCPDPLSRPVSPSKAQLASSHVVCVPQSSPTCFTPKCFGEVGLKPPASPRHKKLQIICSSNSAALSGSAGSWHIPISDTQYSIPTKDQQRQMAEKRRKKAISIAGVDQEQLVDPWLLADPDSRFADFYGVQIHYKIARPDNSGPADVERVTADGPSDRALSRDPNNYSSAAPSSLAFPAILLHGFGASLFSWDRVMHPLAKLLGSKVVAFDRPAFGLTSRIRFPFVRSKDDKEAAPLHLNPYSLEFSSAATRAFIDLLQSDKAILIGHSAGCIVAIDTYLKFPDCVAALVLVAPAVIAPLIICQFPSAQESKHEDNSDTDTKREKGRHVWSLHYSLLPVQKVILWAVGKITLLWQKIKAAATAVWCRLLAATLRSGFATWLLRVIMDRLSLQAVRYAWYDREKVDDYVIEGYTKPLRCRDWEQGLLEYVVALVTDPIADGERSLSDRLGEISCPVMVLTGDSDGLVPAWNAERLAKAMPTAQFKLMKNCGHLPHEEKPDEFLAIVQGFVQQVQQGVNFEMAPNESMWVPA